MKNSRFSPVRILLIDDNQHGLVARRLILQDQGYEVDTAPGGENAMDILQQGSYDVVVTDYRMKKLDGIEFIRQVRESGSPARIILLSGFATALGLTEAGTGADEVIPKSSREVPELLRSVKKLAHMPTRRLPGSAKAVRPRGARKSG